MKPMTIKKAILIAEESILMRNDLSDKNKKNAIKCIKSLERISMGKYDFKTEDEWIDCFRTQFLKHSNEGIRSKTYNKLRDHDTPTWETIARKCNTYSWKKLMELSDVHYPDAPIQTSKGLYIKQVDSPYFHKLEELNQERIQLNNELKEKLKY